MSWAAELLAVQDSLVSAVAAAFPAAKVTTEPVESAVAGSLFAVHLVQVVVEAQNSVVDEATARFRVATRWSKAEGGSGSTSWINRSELLREALLQASPPSYGGVVTEMRWADITAKTSSVTRGDGKWDMWMEYECKLLLNRPEVS